jgi:hypothetical protein
MRVEPVMISADADVHRDVAQVSTSACFRRKQWLPVFAPLLLANSRAATVYGVVPVAAIPMTRSLSIAFRFQDR